MVLRVGGLASGLDTDTVVKQMLTADQNKIDKVKGQRDVLQWQQEIYRDFSSQIKTFQSKYFDVLNKDTYALSNNFFSSLTANILGTDNGIVGIKPNNTAKVGRYEILSMKQAKGTSVEGEKINLVSDSNKKANLNTDLSDLRKVVAKLDENNLSIKLEGAEVVNIDTSTITDVNDLVNAINTTSNNKLNASLKNGKIIIKDASVTNGEQEALNLKLNIDEELSGNTKLSDLTMNTENKLTIKVGTDASVDINISDLKTIGDLVSTINTKLKGKVKASFSEITGKFTIETVETGASTKTKLEVSGDSLSGLGFKTASNSTVNPTKENLYTPQIGGELRDEKGNLLEAYKNKSGEKLDDALNEVYLKDMGFKAGDIKFSINDKELNINIDDNTKVKEFIDKINQQIGADTDLDGKVKADIKDGKFIISSVPDDKTLADAQKEENKIKLSSTNIGFLNRFGITSDDKTTKVESSIVKTNERYDLDISNINTTPTDPTNLTIKVSVQVNGEFKEQVVTIDVSDPSNIKSDNLPDGIKLIEENGKLLLRSQGIGESFIVNADKNVIDFGNMAEVKAGQDSKVIIKTPSGEKGEVTSSKNNIVIDGMSFEIKGDLNADKTLDDTNLDDLTNIISFNVDSNVDKVVDNIKGFVEEYNKLIDSIGNKVYEKKQYKYSPLTDEQKEAMKEDDIKRWEEKAKQGIIRGDDSLEKFLRELRSTLFESVKDTNISLKEIGIDTSDDYTQRGKLVIDETKLREALIERPNDVAELFTKNSEISYDADKGYGGNEERKETTGIFRRMSDIVQDAIRTTRNTNGQKGYLLEKAGIKGDLSEIKNTISDKIKEKDKSIEDLIRKMQDRETQLYKQFSYLETMMNNYNAQSSWLTQQLGGM